MQLTAYIVYYTNTVIVNIVWKQYRHILRKELKVSMTILPSSYEVTSINSLLKGDMYVHNNVSYLVLDKKFDYIEVWNLRTNDKELRKLPMVQTVTRVKGGTISV